MDSAKTGSDCGRSVWRGTSRIGICAPRCRYRCRHVKNTAMPMLAVTLNSRLKSWLGRSVRASGVPPTDPALRLSRFAATGSRFIPPCRLTVSCPRRLVFSHCNRLPTCRYVMTQCVVDLLETVQIDEHQRKRIAAAPLHAPWSARQSIHQQHDWARSIPVRKSCCSARVADRRSSCLFAFGNVGKVCHDVVSGLPAFTGSADGDPATGYQFAVLAPPEFPAAEAFRASGCQKLGGTATTDVSGDHWQRGAAWHARWTLPAGGSVISS